MRGAPKQNHNSARQVQLEEERQGIIKELQHATGKLGQARQLGGRTPEEKAAQAVAKAVERAVNHLRETNLPALADHLQLTIRQVGSGFVYHPGPEAPYWAL